MALFHAVVWLDHHKGRVQQFDDAQAHVVHIKEHTVDTGHHNSGVRTQHEFFGEVCDALAGVSEVLVTSSHDVQTDFRHYVDKHRPALVKQIAGWEIVQEQSDGESVAFARKFFVGHDRMVGTKAIGS